MSKRNLYVLGILLTIMLGLIFWPHKISIPNVQLYKFEVRADSFHYSCSENFNYLKNESKHQKLSPKLNKGVELLKNFEQKQPYHRLILTGYYCKKEQNTSGFLNLGLSRANDVKEYLKLQGFDTNLITTESLEQDILPSDTLFGAISFRLEKDWVAMGKFLNTQPLTAYFPSGTSNTKIMPEDSAKIESIAQVLIHCPKVKVNVIAYTDKTGSKLHNMNLSKARVSFLKNYLIKNGILENRIKSTPKGVDESIVLDDIQSREKCRRAEVLIQ